VTVTVVDVPEQRRFVAREGTSVLGRVDYRVVGGKVRLLHTVVDAPGRGIGTLLAQEVLGQLLEGGAHVVVFCPFLVSWLDKHPELAEQVEVVRE
jgi:hypothetical protein